MLNINNNNFFKSRNLYDPLNKLARIQIVTKYKFILKFHRLESFQKKEYKFFLAM